MFTKWLTVNSLIRQNKLAWRLLLVALACVVLLSNTACSLLPKEEDEEVLPAIAPPKLSKKPEYVVKTETIETKVHGLGQLMAIREEKLFFTVDGKRLKELHVASGDTVHKGQLLAELDVSDLERDLRQKKLYFRKDELQMIEILRKADEMEPEELEQAKIDFELKRTELVDLQTKIDEAKLTAPFDGTIVSVMNNRGDTIQGYNPIMVVADVSELVVTANIGKDDLKNIAVGMEVLVDISTTGQHKGKIKALPVPKEDNNNYDPWNPNPGNKKDSIEDFTVVELEKFPDGVTRGTPISVTVITQRKENAVVIPLAALRTHSGRNYVQVVDEQENKREVDVEVGQKTSTVVEILNGLEPGQKVVGK